MIKLLHIPMVISVMYGVGQVLAFVIKSKFSEEITLAVVVISCIAAIFMIYLGDRCLNYLNRRYNKRLELESMVPGFEGPSYFTWLNTNQVCNRFDGGVTGFFRNKKGGAEFGGIIHGGKIYTTREVYGRWHPGHPTVLALEIK